MSDHFFLYDNRSSSHQLPHFSTVLPFLNKMIRIKIAYDNMPLSARCRSNKFMGIRIFKQHMIVVMLVARIQYLERPSLGIGFDK